MSMHYNNILQFRHTLVWMWAVWRTLWIVKPCRQWYAHTDRHPNSCSTVHILYKNKTLTNRRHQRVANILVWR